MSVKNVIRVSEFEKLYYDETKPFKQKHWEALCRYLETVNKKEEKRVEYFRILNKGIQFTNFVGVIQAGNLTIEVLPKVDKGTTTAANEVIDDLSTGKAAEKAKWQSVLLQMLKECRLLRVNEVDFANLNLQSNSILDIYLHLFLDEVDALSHEGLLKRYRKQEGNQSALKGNLLFSKQVTQNATHAERFYVRFSEYNQDNIFNQLLYKTLRLIPLISTNPFLTDRVGRLLLNFPEISPCLANEATFQRLRWDRKTERYQEALLISKMLLLNYRPDITGGADNVIAILFDMNKLWEEWVYRRLKREETKGNITVQRQQSARFWDSPLLTSPKTIRPDIVIRTDNPVQTIVLDTKWKRVDDLAASDEDLKQMYVYNLFWNCTRSILLYPSNQKAENKGDYFHYGDPSKHYTGCTVQTIPILNDKEKLSADFGRVLLATIFQ